LLHHYLTLRSSTCQSLFLASAIRKHQRKTTIFFFLIFIRQGRNLILNLRNPLFNIFVCRTCGIKLCSNTCHNVNVI